MSFFQLPSSDQQCSSKQAEEVCWMCLIEKNRWCSGREGERARWRDCHRHTVNDQRLNKRAMPHTGQRDNTGKKRSAPSTKSLQACPGRRSVRLIFFSYLFCSPVTVTVQYERAFVWTHKVSITFPSQDRAPTLSHEVLERDDDGRGETNGYFRVATASRTTKSESSNIYFFCICPASFSMPYLSHLWCANWVKHRQVVYRTFLGSSDNFSAISLATFEDGRSRDSQAFEDPNRLLGC